MNQTQRKYLVERINKIVSMKRNEIERKYTKEGVTLSAKEKLKAFKSGRYTIRKGVDTITKWTHVNDLVEFTDESSTEVDQVKVDRDVKKLNAMAIKTTDEIMLGDEKSALALLEKLNNFTV